METETSLIIHTDGGARGNPGPAALGVVIEKPNGELVVEHGEVIGETTNNVAEYSAVLWALQWIVKNREKVSGIKSLNFFLDSELVVRQLTGLYKVKKEHLRDLLFSIRSCEAELNLSIFYTHIPRAQNKHADSMVNKALDKLI